MSDTENRSSLIEIKEKNLRTYCTDYRKDLKGQ